MTETKEANMPAFKAEHDGNSTPPGRASHSIGRISGQESHTVLRSDDSLQRDETTMVYPEFGKAVLILVGLFMGVFLVALDQTIIGTAIPKITDEFNTIQVSH